MASSFSGWGILYAFDFSFDASVLIYSALFAFCYTICNVGIISALKYGPVTLTSLLIGLSLIVTTIWGFIFWDAKVTICNTYMFFWYIHEINRSAKIYGI